VDEADIDLLLLQFSEFNSANDCDGVMRISSLNELAFFRSFAVNEQKSSSNVLLVDLLGLGSTALMTSHPTSSILA
jgi:hypothetical protein